jgi:hypothetical protein
LRHLGLAARLRVQACIAIILLDKEGAPSSDFDPMPGGDRFGDLIEK